MQNDEAAYRNLDETTEEIKKEKPKICPIMAQGWLSNPKIAETEFNVGANVWLPDRLPKCLKESCALWKVAGQFCGLKVQ